jgi:activator of 2-hydroxyglutaryl-CoA dehydratase
MKNNFLGIDVGSVAVSVVLLDEHHQICHYGYTFHNGQIANSLLTLLMDLDIDNIRAVGYTSS